MIQCIRLEVAGDGCCRRRLRVGALIVAGVTLALPMQAQSDPAVASGIEARSVSAMRAVRRIGPIVIDGALDDAAWRAAPAASNFTESYPRPGAPPRDSTSVRVLYDDQALYVAIRMQDTHPDSIAAQLAPRDASAIYSDWVHLIIDSYHDRRTAFRFSVNPLGVQKDVYTYDDGREDVNWDAVWQVGARVDSAGWSAEYRIPLSQLRFGAPSRGAPRVWGIQVMRDIARRAERDSWSPWTADAPGFVSYFGDLDGLDDLTSATHVEVVPYVSSRLTRAPGIASDPFYRHTASASTFGADVRSGLPGGLMFTATVNPDFGQVEADPAVVNLSAFETFFPEKRPFFLEGADIFNFGQVQAQNDFESQHFIYSRRIGRAPEIQLSDTAIAYASPPQQTTIGAAAKVTGQLGPWSVGAGDAITTEAFAPAQTTAGARLRIPVEPAANYWAGRVKRQFRAGASSLGAMFTAVQRATGDSMFAPTLRRSATFGGVDFEHDMQRRNWIVSGYLAGSQVAGNPAAIQLTQRTSTHGFQRPDASYLSVDPTKTSLAGHIGEIALERNGPLFGSVAVKEVSPGFELNDFGFIGRVDYRSVSSLVGYQQFTAGALLHGYNIMASTTNAWNFGAQAIHQDAGGSASVTFNNLWSASVSGGRTFAAFDDRLLRGGPLARAPAGWNATGSISTDSRWPVIVTLNGSYQRDASGGESPSVGIGFDARPAPSVHVTLTPTWSLTRSTAQYIRAVTDASAPTYGARYVFANLRQATLDVQMRFEWTLTTALSLRTYLQPFASSGVYSAYKEFLAAGTYRFGVYGRDQGSISQSGQTITADPDGAGPAPSFTFTDPAFTVRSLRGNAVLRWDYRPGSAVFVVWQQQRSGYDATAALDAPRAVGAIFRTVPTNILLVKATFWITR